MDKRDQLLASYLDNTATYKDADRQGIFLFLKDWFPDVFTSKWAEHHFLMTKIFWEMYHPSKTNRFQRQGYYVIHREAAKTTFNTFGIPQYLIWLRGYRPWVRYDAEGWEGSDRHDYELIQLPPIAENLIVICSETANQSSYFVSNIKDTIDSRPDMSMFFGPKDPKGFVSAMEEQGYDASAVLKNKWTNDAFITADGTVVVGRGAGQQVRGLNIRNSRPTLILVDDMYSRNNTITENRIEGLNRWFFAELSNSLDGTHGKIFFLGTLVNENTVIRTIEKSDQWFGLSRPIIGYEELQMVLENHCRISDGIVTIPGYEECRKIQQTLKTLSWPDKHDLFYILNIYKREFEQGRGAYFYQEYLNMTQAPEEARFNRDHLKPTTFTFHRDIMGPGQHMVNFDFEGRSWWAWANNVIGIDIASSEKVNADHTVIVVASMLRAKAFQDGSTAIDERIFPAIVTIVGGRGWGTFEERRPNVHRRGIVEEVIKILESMPVETIICETNSTQENTRRAIDYELYKRGIKVPVVGKFSEAKKQDRIISILEPIFSKYKTILYDRSISSYVETFFKQLTMLSPSETKDDYPDAASIAFSKTTINPLDFHLPGDVSRVHRSADHRDIRRFGHKAWELL
jgi:hypothetical protein